MPNSSTTSNTQGNSITPEKIRRSKRLCPEYNEATENTNTSIKNPPPSNKEVKSILCTNTSTAIVEKEKDSNRVAFLTDLHITKFATYCKLLFEVQGLSKPTQVVQILLIRIVDKAQQFEAQFHMVKYLVSTQKNNVGVAVKLDQLMKEVPIFLK